MKKKIVRLGVMGVILILQLALLSACTSSCNGGGGGGGGSGGVVPPAPVNQAPVITSAPVTVAITEQAYSYDVEATDANGDILTYSLDIFPTGMNIVAVSGVINWTPGIGQVGDHQVKVKVSDGATADYQEYTLTVSLPPNNVPVITSTPITTAISGDVYVYSVTATDADGDILTYSLDIFPTGMTINGTSGLISWVPTVGQAGDHQVKVKVTDGEDSVYQEYTLAVSLPPPNQAPIITTFANTLAVSNIGYSYDVNAIDPESDTLVYSLVTFPSGMSINSSNGLIDWTPTLGQVGNHWVEIEVSDGDTSDYQKYAIRVSPSDNGVPFMRGCVLTSWWYTDYTSAKVEATLLQMKEDGCDTVLVLITRYQDSTTSTTIYSRVQKSPTDAGVTHVTNYAHSLGMDVYFKVHVDIPDGTWRGYITFSNEADWAAWWSSYNAYISHYLDLAESLGIEGFIIGTELVGTEHRETDWRATVALGRSKFFGLITYSANHDSYDAITWWDALDFIGISAYFPLTGSYTPTVAQLNTGWLPWIGDLNTFATTWSMDIVFLELGYQSRNGTNTSPWWAPTNTVDLQEQADCYQAAFESLYDEHWFKGMAWWMWYWDPIQNVDGFDVFNKPAEDVLSWWYAGY